MLTHLPAVPGDLGLNPDTATFPNSQVLSHKQDTNSWLCLLELKLSEEPLFLAQNNAISQTLQIKLIFVLICSFH